MKKTPTKREREIGSLFSYITGSGVRITKQKQEENDRNLFFFNLNDECFFFFGKLKNNGRITDFNPYKRKDVELDQQIRKEENGEEKKAG